MKKEARLAVPSDLNKFDTFTDIIAKLRGPDGCPWDKEQTHQSLRENLLSESYEALEALDSGEPAKLQEELGDLLLQIVLQSQIAADSGEFKIDDVIKGIAEKIIRRHPHVFGDWKASNAKEVMHNWEELKKQEREEGASILSTVPKAMPALSYALEISRRAVRVGFEWPDIEGVIDKVTEEVGEIKKAANREEKAHEIGDLLFTLVNYARWEGIDAESALREANLKFFQRFTYMEKLCHERDLSFEKLSFDEQNAMWDEAKRHTNI
jgi:tetrapyrrole methylase family protein / MazG family protein